jgi:phage terminase small subunit
MDAPSDKTPPRLTAKQRRFIEEYCVARRRKGASAGLDFNGTQAAIRAGYAAKSAAESGCENLKKPHIRQAIDARMAEFTQRTTMQAEEVLDRVSRMARVNVLNKSKKLHCVGEARVVLSSLELLGKYHKLWTERQEVSGVDGKPIEFALPTMSESADPVLPEEAKQTGDQRPETGGTNGGNGNRGGNGQH